ncbi:hypothetical protein QFZ37_001164 [Chryseobacterium ginsenosidimutans]|uniref:DUF3108 domain-containing protein n=1 Tax=Chryseobacterium ginsenosidimutans TaxID=687846 RepID=UPI002786826B|nr:hypothetical protein [Chryseobacterium ginsenosidimutans]MDQ0592795.1 hypothetical protein [Chryseobacterium ginsenosidimutans]
MRIFLILLIISSAQFFAQKTLNPGTVKLESKYIKDEISNAVWYAQKGDQKMEIGKITNEVKKVDKTTLLIKTSVKMNQAPETTWVDSTLVKISNFEPIYHSSYNVMRDMRFKFEKNKVTGYYLDKKTQKKDNIDEKVSVQYFDSNSYPGLIRFLPLKEHYSTEMPIYDYNPAAKKGVIKAYIEDVNKGELNGKKVWIVKATDDIQDRKTIVTYYIDTVTREVLKQDIDSNGRKMVMETVK